MVVPYYYLQKGEVSIANFGVPLKHVLGALEFLLSICFLILENSSLLYLYLAAE